MRIAHVTDCYLPRLGGIELQVHDLASRQAARHEVTIFTITGGSAPGSGGAAAGAREGGGVEVVNVGSPRRVVGAAEVSGSSGPRRAAPSMRIVGQPAEKIRYRRARFGPARVAASDFDIVHVHASSFSPLAFLVARNASRRGVPTVATVHSMWAKASPLFDGADLLCGWGDWPVAWSAVSNAAARPLRDIVGRRGDVTVLANGVDPTQWEVNPVLPSPNELRIVAVSRLASRKRVVQLVHILRRARTILPASVRLNVEILGDGPQMAEMASYLDVHGMTGWVHLRGRASRAEIRSVFAGSDLFVAPASLESFGIAALEARSAGLPVLARTGTGVADFIRHGIEGWLVDSDVAMSETIVSLARSPEILARVAVHNRIQPSAVNWVAVERSCQRLYERAARIQGRRGGGGLPREIGEVFSGGGSPGVSFGVRSGGRFGVPSGGGFGVPSGGSIGGGATR